MLLKEIRQSLKSHSVDAILVPHTDEFLSEHLTPDKERLAALTGFTGSAGLVIVTQKTAILFTDSRYTDQARGQTTFTVIDVANQKPTDWIRENLTGKTVVFHAGTIRASIILQLIKDLPTTHFEPILDNWIDLYWKRRPRAQNPKPFSYSVRFSGEKTDQKCHRLAQQIRAKKWDAYFVSDPEDAAWILNKRSRLNPAYPGVFERFCVDKNGKIIPLKKIQNKKIGVCLSNVPYDLYQQIPNAQPTGNLIANMRAVKNETEIDNIRKQCLFESAVLSAFIAHVHAHKNSLTELDCVKKLHELRTHCPYYLGDSFDAITAVGAHAAMAHYKPSKATNVSLTSSPLFLFDTGGQYLRATTDATRTIAVGKPTPFIKKRYTQVLKGHIALTLSKIKSGSFPIQLDKKARSFLAADGATYGHSTGHGIGMCLSVHEPVPFISSKSKTPLYPNMIFSNEPGYYDSKRGFGIRLENMLLSVKNGKNLSFENLLFVPFDSVLTDKRLLTTVEKKWLKTYHQKIKTDILPLVSDKTQDRLMPILDFFTNLC